MRAGSEARPQVVLYPQGDKLQTKIGARWLSIIYGRAKGGLRLPTLPRSKASISPAARTRPESGACITLSSPHRDHASSPMDTAACTYRPGSHDYLGAREYLPLRYGLRETAPDGCASLVVHVRVRRTSRMRRCRLQ